MPESVPVAIASLDAFVASHRRLVVLTGAGCSTDSGIPDYRDDAGEWKRSPPMTWQVFTGSEAARCRYWARSFVGWPRIAQARPNPAHAALERLEARGGSRLLITQNVDGLHQKAGSRSVLDLHGRLDRVVCLACTRREPRASFQDRMQAANPGWSPRRSEAATAPDGDADLEDLDLARFRVPDCLGCGGMLKPDVVFFGESVPRDRVEAAMQALAEADGLLVVGSSLMVFSGYRFAREAAARGLPIVAVNRGRSRADHLYALKDPRPAAEALAFLLADPPSAPAGLEASAARR